MSGGANLGDVESGVQWFARRDPYWPAQLTIVAAIALQIDLPHKLTLLPGWVLPVLEGVLLAGLIATTPRGEKPPRSHAQRRRFAIVVVGIVSAANLVSLGLLIHFLVIGGSAGGRPLIMAGIEIWVTNVLLFAVWYWEIDRGGPQARKLAVLEEPDFLFPQMTQENLGGLNWRAGYVDYLYVSFTNAAAFSPTDTMPLSQLAKMLMLVQSGASLVTLGLVVARAVNILT
jgi:uncharacterized membrane protein